MKINTRLYTLIGVVLTFYFQSFASTTTDTITSHSLNLFQKVLKYFEESNEARPDKKFDFGIIGGPHYSSTTKLGLGITASGSYRTQRDSTTQLSNIALYGDATTAGFLLIGIEGHHYFPRNAFRIDYNLSLYTFPGDFWGIGYDMGNNNRNKSSYKRLEASVQVNWLAQIIPNLYGGITTCFNHVRGTQFTNISLLDGQPGKVSSIGAGMTIVYDSRDMITNAYRGTYAQLNQRFYPKIMGNKRVFTHTDFTFCYYHRAWEGAVIAFDLHGEFNYGSVPWNMLASLGGSSRMRGYYEGRYRDKNLLTAQIELRQHLWRRNGIVVWAGMGNIFPSFAQLQWRHTLPNYGIGYRWEFKNRVNIRLDYGFGKKGQSGFLFNINEAF